MEKIITKEIRLDKNAIKRIGVNIGQTNNDWLKLNGEYYEPYTVLLCDYTIDDELMTVYFKYNSDGWLNHKGGRIRI